MPSPRRTKALLVALMSVLGLTLFLTYYTSSSQSPYMRTLRSVTSPGGRLSSSSEPVVPALPAAVYPEARAEIFTLLEANAVVVFSKSYCPYSKKAKALLLDKYSIVPAPYVVELDLRDNGAQLQAELEVVTGRGTVPVGFPYANARVKGGG